MSTPRFTPVDDRNLIAADLVTTTELPKAEIARQAGLPDAKAVDAAMRLPYVRGYLSDELDRAEATLASAAKVISEAQRADDIRAVGTAAGVEKVNVGPDHAIRLKAAELNLKARGELRETQGSANIFLGMTDEQVAKIAAGELKMAALIDVGPRIENPAIERPAEPGP